MKTFNVYQHPTLGYQAVKVGFCWPAFFFGGIWALVSKMWVASALIWLIGLIAGAIAAAIAGGVLGVVDLNMRNEGYTGAIPSAYWDVVIGFAELVGFLIVQVVVGINGNKWRSKNLLGRGYEKIATVHAGNKEAALANCVRGNPQSDLQPESAEGVVAKYPCPYCSKELEYASARFCPHCKKSIQQ